MISGLAKSGMPIEAFDMYRQMQKEGVEGDGVVMVGLKQVCANLGDLKTGPFCSWAFDSERSSYGCCGSN